MLCITKPLRPRRAKPRGPKNGPTTTITLTGVLALSLFTACAHQAPSPHGRRTLKDPGPLAQAWRLPSRCVKADGAVLSETELYQELDGVRVVYIGERHASPHDHAAQIQVIHGLHQQNASLAIGLEMVKRPFQKWLDGYIAGEVDEETLLEGTEWKRRWGFDFTLYRPILAYAREHGIPLVALNIKDEITRKVAREGLDSLSSEDRARVPEIDFDDAEHRAMVKAVYDKHMGGGKMTFENFYTAQLLWDETMATEVANVMNGAQAPRTMVVLAGAGHVQYQFGIPKRAARRGASPFKTIVPVLLDRADEPIAAMAANGVADYLWVMSGNPDDLPRVGPHPHPPSSRPASRPTTAMNLPKATNDSGPNRLQRADSTAGPE